MRILTLTATLASFALPAAADDAALLLGVERYQDLRRTIDGTDLLRPADDLRDAGYEVTTLANGSARDTTRLLNQFMVEAEDADRLVVGMSGRFVTDGARTWFLSADARRPTMFGMGDSIVSLESVMAILAQTPGQAVLVLGLDTGADESLDTYLREGLGNLRVPQGVTVLIGAPSEAEDVLEEAVAEPGSDVMAYTRDNRRLDAIGFTPDTLIMQPEVTTQTPTPRPSTDPTVTFWNDAREANTADSYRDFLFAFPDSPYAQEARARLDEIENDPVRIDRLAEEGLNLSRNEQREIQRNLTLLEYNTRGVDGIFGPGSRSAIRNWQQTNGFTQTSYLTAEQISRIDAQASRRAAEIEAEQERERQEALRLDRAYWEETGAREDEAGYRAYLDRYPEGIFSEEASNKLNELTGASQAEQQEQARRDEQALNVNPILARLIESRLDQLGFDPGPVDGRFDSQTREALGRYQSRRNLPATGYLNEPTLARLLTDTFGR